MNIPDIQLLIRFITETLCDPSDSGKWLRTGLIIGGFTIFLVAAERWTGQTEEKKVGPLTFSNLKLLDDGLYTVGYPLGWRNIHTVVTRSEPEKYDTPYCIPTDEIPRNPDGTLVEHFIKEDGYIS